MRSQAGVRSGVTVTLRWVAGTLAAALAALAVTAGGALAVTAVRGGTVTVDTVADIVGWGGLLGFAPLAVLIALGPAVAAFRPGRERATVRTGALVVALAPLVILLVTRSLAGDLAVADLLPVLGWAFGWAVVAALVPTPPSPRWAERRT